MTLWELHRHGRQLLAANPPAQADAGLLLRTVLGWTEARFIAAGDGPIAPHLEARFLDWIGRRRRGEPVAYLLGRRGFCNLELAVDAAVLVPRPETELLVEQVGAVIGGTPEASVLELGTGSGAISLALSAEFPDCDIIASDISPAALRVAAANQRRLRGRVRWHLGDWYHGLAGNRFDMICSNPPYIRAGDPHLQGDGVRFEPRLALVAGATGMEAHQTIIPGAADFLNPGGWLMLEHGCDQGAAMRGLMHDAGYREIETVKDLSGNERVTRCRKLF